MKRYLLFAGDKWYPSGGMNDFKGSFDEQDDAYRKALNLQKDWYQIYDTEENVIVQEEYK